MVTCENRLDDSAHFSILNSPFSISLSRHLHSSRLLRELDLLRQMPPRDPEDPLAVQILLQPRDRDSKLSIGGDVLSVAPYRKVGRRGGFFDRPDAEGNVDLAEIAA